MAGMIDNSSAPQFVTRQEIGSILDDWYAKKQPLQQSAASPNQSVYTPSYTQQAAAPQQQAAPQEQAAPQQQSYQPQNYGFRPYMGGYGMQTPFAGYGAYGGYGGGYYPPSGFGMGGYGYGQMYNPFSMY